MVRQGLLSTLALRSRNDSYGDRQHPKTLITPVEAAEILHLSRSRLMHLKHKLPHVKIGEHKQGRVLFIKETLIEAYNNINC